MDQTKGQAQGQEGGAMNPYVFTIGGAVLCWGLGYLFALYVKQMGPEKVDRKKLIDCQMLAGNYERQLQDRNEQVRRLTERNKELHEQRMYGDEAKRRKWQLDAQTKQNIIDNLSSENNSLLRELESVRAFNLSLRRWIDDNVGRLAFDWDRDGSDEAIDALIVRLHRQGVSNRRIETIVFGYAGGAAYDRVRRVVGQIGDAGPECFDLVPVSRYPTTTLLL